MRIIRLLIILCCTVVFLSVQAQPYQGTYEKCPFTCPIAGTSEGYLMTTDDRKIEIVSHIPLNDGLYEHVLDGRWGEKECAGSYFYASPGNFTGETPY